MDFYGVFAQELRMYKLTAEVGVRIALYTSTNMHFFQQHSSAFSKQQKHLPSGPSVSRALFILLSHVVSDKQLETQLVSGVRKELLGQEIKQALHCNALLPNVHKENYYHFH